MRAAFWPILAVLAAGACGGGTPWSPVSCPQDPDGERARIDVVVSSFTTVVRHDLNLAQVGALPGMESAGPSGKRQGVTVFRHRLNYTTAIALSGRLLQSGSCAWLEKLTVDLTPEKAEIYVPSDYMEDSCEYQQILAHEHLHDDTHRDALTNAANVLRADLAKAGLPGRGLQIAVADRPEAEKLIEARIDAVTKPVFAGFKAELDERQAVIDLPENYRWTASRCADWK
jgi:hypothetical protein